MHITEAADICKILSDPHRLQIMKALVDGEKCASDLLKDFTISQPTLSHHMKTLVAAKLLTDRKAGKKTYYTINRKTWDEFMLTMDTISNEKYW